MSQNPIQWQLAIQHNGARFRSFYYSNCAATIFTNNIKNPIRLLATKTGVSMSVSYFTNSMAIYICIATLHIF